MKRYLLILTCIVAVQTYAQQVFNDRDYYENLDGLSGQALFNAVHQVAGNNFSQLSYNGLWAAYAVTDIYPEDSTERAGQIWDMYGEFDFDLGTNQCGNYSKPGDCYNREHSIPKSWFGGSTAGMGADLFHIVPTDGKINGDRGNYAFGEVLSGTYNKRGNKMGSGANITITSTLLGEEYTTQSAPTVVFEPIDQYKGDFARGYLGTMIKWTDVYTMNNGDGSWFFSNQYDEDGLYGLDDYGLALLLKWHREDPVSRKEIDRNNGIQQQQGNRNPFIDFPYLVEYIWGEKAGQTLALDSLYASFDPNFVQGVSNGWGRVVATQIDEHCPQHEAVKTMLNGRIYILRSGVMYNMLGRSK